MKGRKREKNINVRLPLTHPAPGTWPTTQAYALTGNRTGDPSVHWLMLNTLRHTSHGSYLGILIDEKEVLNCQCHIMHCWSPKHPGAVTRAPHMDVRKLGHWPHPAAWPPSSRSFSTWLLCLYLCEESELLNDAWGEPTQVRTSPVSQSLQRQ